MSLKLETQLRRSQNPLLTESSCSINISSRKGERVVRATECWPWDAKKEAGRSTEEACSCQGTERHSLFPPGGHLLNPSHFRDPDCWCWLTERCPQPSLNVSKGLNQDGPPTGQSGEGPGQEEYCFKSELFVALGCLELAK